MAIDGTRSDKPNPMHNFKPSAKNKRGKGGEFKNYTKYKGIKPIYFRSKYELVSMMRCVYDESIRLWTVEPFGINYTKPNGKQGTYYIDLLIQRTDGSMQMVEIKPHQQVHEGSLEFEVNERKWNAAIKYCKDQTDSGRPLEFVIWSQKTLRPWARKFGIVI